MARLPVLWCRLVLPLLAAGLGACASSSGLRRPGFFSGSSVTVRGVGMMEVQDAVIETFQDHGFRLASSMGRRMIFEKQGTRNDTFMFGGFRDEPQTQRLEVTLGIGDDPDIIGVHCSGQTVREPGNAMGEESGLGFANGRWRYDQHLREAKRRAERAAGRQ